MQMGLNIFEDNDSAMATAYCKKAKQLLFDKITASAPTVATLPLHPSTSVQVAIAPTVKVANPSASEEADESVKVLLVVPSE